MAFFLLLETGMIGVFCALDFFLFYVFWEAMLIPMYFIIGIWGGARRIYAAVKFFLFTMVGSLLMLVAMLVVYVLAYEQTGVLDLNLVAAPGTLDEAGAATVVDAAGRIVAPGFIDVHTHDDWAVLEDPALACKITQGVTTVVVEYRWSGCQAMRRRRQIRS